MVEEADKPKDQKYNSWKYTSGPAIMSKEERDEIREGKKKEFLELLKANKGLVYFTCDKFGLPYQTHLNWYNADPDYASEVDEINEHVNDFVESKLYKVIQKESVPAIMFYLKTKGKRRGYVEDKSPDSKDKDEEYQVQGVDKDIIEQFRQDVIKSIKVDTDEDD